ncbi:hypothetical protein M501DRAFT_1059146 [Patellaria atrata CBS 101060]|uniref:HAT C-terminal dimerisation domain-containing protein n=1 Tax=Patellaria atrata CBS 101060 TaxID=1346257 RepID=A0A9P4VNF3_9PEZI|nr:hypothetical protein M501DRAFT_1059146 [Patellaria atrata CBS 101060]
MERVITTRSSARTAVPLKKLREAQEEDGEASRPTKKPRRQKKVSNTQYSQSTAESSAGEPEKAPAGDAQGGDESSHRISEYIESSASDDEVPEGAVPPERIQIRGKWYLKDSGAIKIDRREKKTSHIWSKGYEIISEAFLLGKASDETLVTLNSTYSQQDLDSDNAIWRCYGAVGRLYNIVRYIRLTPQRRQEFKEIKIGGELMKYDDLEVFYEATMLNEGNKSSISNWFSTLDYLLDRLDDTKLYFQELVEEYPENEDMADSVPVYYAAQFLQPGLKWSWFSDKMDGHIEKKHWLRGNPRIAGDTGIQGKVRQLYTDEYKGRYSQIEVPPQSTHPPIDFFDEYSAHDTREIEALIYWNERYKSQPDLARMGLDMAALPCMSDECERVFSPAKHLISDARNRLQADIIETSECLRSWFGPLISDEANQSKKNGSNTIDNTEDIVKEASIDEQGDGSEAETDINYTLEEP